MDWKVQLVEIEVTDEDVNAVLDCLRSGWLTMGPRTNDFEAAFAERVGVKFAPTLSSGTAALHMACLAAGVGPGDEVIVPSVTFVATAHAPRYCGAETILCDVESPENPLMSVEAVESLITPRTKAVIAVHMWGYSAPIAQLRELCERHGIVLIEDCAEANGGVLADGSPVGSGGALGCFSFFSKKQLAVGEGGAVTTDNAEMAARVRSLRSHAMTSVTWERHKGHGLGYDIPDFGFNFRMDEPRAALALSRMKRLDHEVERRREVAMAYRERLAGVDGLTIPFSDEDAQRSAHFAFPILVADGAARDATRAHMSSEGVQSTWYPAIHTLTAYRDGVDLDRLKVSGEVSDRHLTLPIHSHLDEETIEIVCAAVESGVRAPASQA